MPLPPVKAIVERWAPIEDGHTSINDWNCGDHGSDYEWKAILDAHDGVLHAKFQSFECQAGGAATKLIEEMNR
jgi:hypothetical protein